MSTQTCISFELAEPTVHSLTDMVIALMSNRMWWTPLELCEEIWRTRGIRVSDSTATARIRDCRKPQFGGHTVSIRRRSGSKMYEYRLED